MKRKFMITLHSLILLLSFIVIESNAFVGLNNASHFKPSLAPVVYMFFGFFAMLVSISKLYDLIKINS